MAADLTALEQDIGIDPAALDAALCQPDSYPANLLDRPADQRPTGRIRILFGGVAWFAWWRIAAIMANASITSDTGRCQPCQERVSL